MAGMQVESHEDHSQEEIHAQDITYHSHSHAEKSGTNEKESSQDCPHFHLHCTSLCLGALLGNGHHVAEIFSYQVILQFPDSLLFSQKHSSRLYRPPIT